MISRLWTPPPEAISSRMPALFGIDLAIDCAVN